MAAARCFKAGTVAARCFQAGTTSARILAAPARISETAKGFRASARRFQTGTATGAHPPIVGRDEVIGARPPSVRREFQARWRCFGTQFDSSWSCPDG
ncbi:hypothetical protein E2562_033303 [Oryza meyeriana var. granulata]|uniref:Uncharacterized protein n=1 Tax=Oryza meyeriana var. granulata TaxID=110450 RepID=A0A6G1F0W5_9ORYZ|nr:hypothetical protein E2562_033303 [Oryza meyeriana var. granulata]